MKPKPGGFIVPVSKNCIRVKDANDVAKLNLKDLQSLSTLHPDVSNVEFDGRSSISSSLFKEKLNKDVVQVTSKHQNIKGHQKGIDGMTLDGIKPSKNTKKKPKNVQKKINLSDSLISESNKFKTMDKTNEHDRIIVDNHKSDVIGVVGKEKISGCEKPKRKYNKKNISQLKNKNVVKKIIITQETNEHDKIIVDNHKSDVIGVVVKEKMSDCVKPKRKYNKKNKNVVKEIIITQEINEHDRIILDNQETEVIGMVGGGKISDCEKPKQTYKKKKVSQLKNVGEDISIAQREIKKRKKKMHENDDVTETLNKKTKKSKITSTNGAVAGAANSSVNEMHSNVPSAKLSSLESYIQPYEPGTPGLVPSTGSVPSTLKKDTVLMIEERSGHNLKENNVKMVLVKKQHKKRQVLSQPHKKLSHKERLIWLQERREIGVWVQCSRAQCQKWRYLNHIKDPIDLPKQWLCENNPDLKFNNCSIKEVGPNECEEEDMIYSQYTAGSIVWAKISGYPWWPAMVDDCPDTEQYYWLDGFSDIPTHYNVVFFDSEPVTRAWVTSGFIKPFSEMVGDKDYAGKFSHRIISAMIQADNASKYGIKDRLKQFSFLSMYKGRIESPLKVKSKSKRGLKPLKQIPVDHESSSSGSLVDFPLASSSGSLVDFPLASSSGSLVDLPLAIHKPIKNVQVPTEKHKNLTYGKLTTDKMPNLVSSNTDNVIQSSPCDETCRSSQMNDQVAGLAIQAKLKRQSLKLKSNPSSSAILVGENYVARPKRTNCMEVTNKKDGNISVSVTKTREKSNTKNINSLTPCTQMAEETINDFETFADKKSFILTCENPPVDKMSVPSNADDAIQSYSNCNTFNHFKLNDMVADRAIQSELEQSSNFTSDPYVYMKRSTTSPILKRCADQSMLNDLHELSTFSPSKQEFIPSKPNLTNARSDFSRAAHPMDDFIYEASGLQYSINFALESAVTNDRIYQNDVNRILSEEIEGVVPSTEEALNKLDLKQYSEVSNGSGDFEF